MERRIHVLHEAGLFAGQLAVRMKRDAINDIMGEDLALQDYLAEELREFVFDEDDPVSCLKYAAKVMETLNKASDHINKGYKLGLSDDERQLTDIDNIAKKSGIEFERNRGFCFELMYVGEWLENKICS